MAYFPNGSAGEILDNQCAECPLGKEPCPIAATHLFYNYDQFDKQGQPIQVAVDILNTLVNKEGICQLKPMLAKMTPPEPERIYDPMSPELRQWAVKHGLPVRSGV